METKISTCRKIRLWFIKTFKGEDSYYIALARYMAVPLAKRLESPSHPGYVAKRAISRYMDVSVRTVDVIARDVNAEPRLFNKTSYFTVEEAVEVLTKFC